MRANNLSTTAGMRKSAKRRLSSALLAVVLTSTMALTMTGADAESGIIAAGCKNKTFTQKYGVAGATFYGMKMVFRYCWTRGTSSQSKNYNFRGDTYPWANGIYQVQNDRGPTNSSKVSISESWRDSDNSTTIYFWFQSRGCATGNLNFACTGWVWHKFKFKVLAGGSITLESRS